MNDVIHSYSKIPDDVDTIVDICHHIEFHLTDDAPDGHYNSISIHNIATESSAVVDEFMEGEDIAKTFMNIITTLIEMEVNFEILLTVREK